jgi:hypothetical protein
LSKIVFPKWPSAFREKNPGRVAGMVNRVVERLGGATLTVAVLIVFVFLLSGGAAGRWIFLVGVDVFLLTRLAAPLALTLLILTRLTTLL